MIWFQRPLALSDALSLVGLQNAVEGDFTRNLKFRLLAEAQHAFTVEKVAVAYAAYHN